MRGPDSEGSIDTAVVVPAYNEAATIRDVVTGLLPHADAIFVVDDGSTDGTAEQLAGLPITLMRHATNRGKGAALHTGFVAAAGRAPGRLLTIDADGQHTVDVVPDMLARADERPGCLIVGRRVGKRGTAPPLRRVANRLADRLISRAAGCQLPDTQSGLRVYPATALFGLLDRRRRWSSRFAWEAEVLIELCRSGMAVTSVDVPAIYDRVLRPSHYRPWRDTLRITGMIARKLMVPDTARGIAGRTGEVRSTPYGRSE